MITARTALSATLVVALTSAPLLAGSGSQAGVQCTDENHCEFPRWEAPIPATQGAVGYEVVVQDDVALVGAPGTQEVFVYRAVYGDWQLVQVLTPPLGYGAEGFGEALGVMNQGIYVGAARDDTLAADAGIVFGYEPQPDGTYLYDVLLISSDPVPGGRFGSAIAAQGEELAIGEPGNGAVQLYEHLGGNVWDQERLEYGDDAFGTSVDIGENLLVVGDKYDDTEATNAGAVYVFHLAWVGGIYIGKITADDGSLGDLLGSRVATDGTTIVAGAPYDDDDGASSGSIYVFEYDGFSVDFLQKLTACDAESNSHFGHDVGVDGKRLIAGAPGAGTAYVFERSSPAAAWKRRSHLTSGDVALGNGDLGWSVEIAGAYPLVGAPRADAESGLWTTGAVHRFSLANAALGGADCPCDTQAATAEFGDGKPGFWGLPRLECIEPPVLGEVTTLRLSNVTVTSYAWLLFGLTPAALPFDLGMIYVDAPIFIPLGFVDGSGTLDVSYPISMSPSWCGVTLTHQVLSLDPGAAGPVGTSQTNAVVLIPGS